MTIKVGLDDDADRVVEAVDDLGDPEDNSAGVLVQSGAQSHLVLESIIYYHHIIISSYII